MGRYRGTPGVDSAEKRLMEIAERALAEGRQFLPCLSECVRRCGLSRVTVHRAIRRLAVRGLLSVEPHRGVHINQVAAPLAPHEVESAPSLSHPPRWQQIRDTLEAHLAVGVYAPGATLPSAKLFCREFGAARVTVVRALGALAQQGRLEPFGRGYRVRRSCAGALGASIAVIAASSEMTWLAQATPRSAEFWRCLQQECHHRRLNTRVVSATEALGRGARSIGALTESGALGFVLLPLAIPADRLRVLVSALCSTARQVSVLDETDSLRSAQVRVESRLLQHISMATTDASGRAVGTFLADLGHRSVAFVTGLPEEPNSVRRMEGVSAALTEVVSSGRVYPAHPDPPLHVERTLNALPAYARYRDAVLRHSAVFMRQVAGREREVPVDDFTWPLARCEIEKRAYRPVFTRLLAEPATAWVCFSDELGLRALEFLRERRVAVPRRLSVVGFDDTLAALSAGLTSYNFNVPAVVNAMLEHILSPRTRHGKRGGHIEIPGMVMARASSGRPQ
ncbi:MAG: GntR family transcriptional regulator [Chitinivibrionales bacterium]|nr:GntR family transcriptional regulator [Chitinivibrionales bacterium]